MRIAIVGGGAAGLVSAYLLSGRHAVTLFEAEDELGGNIRTLHGNVACDRLDPQHHLDAGVIEFDESKFRTFSRLLDELKIERREVPGTTALFLRDGRRLRSRANIAFAPESRWAKLAATARLLPLLGARRRFERRTARLSDRDLSQQRMGEHLDDSAYGVWLRMLLMYAYSIAYGDVDDIGAALGVPMLRAFTGTNEWTAIRGGTYAYVERLVESMNAEIRTRSRVVRLARSEQGVTAELAGGAIEHFDAIVVATPPDRVLKLLERPTREEQRRFAGWTTHRVETVVHSDTGMYARRGAAYYSEFDVFETLHGAGYNAYLNRMSGVPLRHPHHYFLAFGLDSEIDPERVLHVQAHSSPAYTMEALRYRDEVIAYNGEHRTYFAGAWLGDGLHEGAVRSAVEVSRLLDGRVL